jgi:glycosyltransferase involved in cell wall biosynthesis
MTLASDQNLIHHCYPGTLNDAGGVTSYLKSLLSCKMPRVSDKILTTLKDIDQSQFLLLHVHGRSLLHELQGKCPVLYTQHNHSSYCPSGTKYLANKKACCDRTMTPLNCVTGHLIDRCGSYRPMRILQNLQGSSRELDTLKKLKIIVAANSDYVRNQLVSNGFPRERVVTLRLGVTIPENYPEPLTLDSHKNQRILFAGRITPEKGLDWLLESLKHTAKHIHLDVAGDGWSKPQMERLSNQLGLSDRVTWYGWCDGEELESLYQQCFAVIFPSLWPEPAGLISLEAYAHFRPVIASSVGGIPEYIREEKTGILVPANDIEALSDAITHLATNFQKGSNMGKRGHEWFLKEFTSEMHSKKLQNIYEKTIDDFQSSIST